MRTKNYRYSIIEKRKLKSYKKSIFIYLFLIIVISVLLLYLGIPLIVKALNISEIFKKSTSTINVSDNIPPVSPKFHKVSEYLNQSSLEIEGAGEPGSNIVIVINNKEEQLLANSEGIFKTTIDLINGENKLYAYSTDSSNNKSANSSVHRLIVDKDAPTIEITKPAENDIFYGKNNQIAVIEGKTEIQSKILINDKLSYVNSDGFFKYNYLLSSGNNTIIIKSTDRAGNSSEKIFSLFYAE